MNSELLSALKFAADQHRDQRRKGAHQAPYINHIIEVVETLAHVGKVTDDNILIAAALHDVVEDTAIKPEEIAQKFGAKVARIVAEVTDDKSLPKPTRKQKQIEHAPHLSTEAKHIKLADKISNIREVGVDPGEGWDKQRRLDYVAWGESVINAGLRGVNADLEKLFDQTVMQTRTLIESNQ